ncbi:DNA-3-methyladenine glycosylase 2 family protein [Vibrio cortegadensis]|uniref:DNA-3-methyladenine glycosylase II n=1 Tax=Vibrio cortegadensis TaxID=1328770 RepID=A0ABV4M3L5_9VIBR
MEVESRLSIEECQKARKVRDPRFDGQFYIAVKTTGIFCRPICPAVMPKEENVEYYHHAIKALQSGYRPCLRCRPDSAPHSWAWKGTETTFQRAITMIERGELQTQSLAELAKRLGISDRYLRQLFDKHLGMSPKQYAQYHQLMFAKQLLHTSSMSIGDVSFACGFNSIRRFNDAFKKYLKLTPSQMRKNTNMKQSTHQLSLAFRAPFNWQHMLNFYRLRAISSIEIVDENSYQRHFIINGVKGWFKASLGKSDVLDISFELDDMTQLQNLVSQLRRMFDLDIDIHSIEEQLEQSAPGLIKEHGLRIPGVWNAWEAGVRAILGQQVSVKAAIGQLNLLVDTLGEQTESAMYFPTPEKVASSDVSFLRMPNSRKETLSRFARYMCENFDEHPSEWLSLKGIGPWTINYALLRGLSQSDCFLDTDLVVKKAMIEYTNLNQKSVAPWGSYATFHCWNL